MGCNDSPDKLARQVLTVFRRNDPQFLDAATSEYGNSVTRCRTLAGAGVLQRAMRRGVGFAGASLGRFSCLSWNFPFRFLLFSAVMKRVLVSYLVLARRSLPCHSAVLILIGQGWLT